MWQLLCVSNNHYIHFDCFFYLVKTVLITRLVSLFSIVFYVGSAQNMEYIKTFAYFSIGFLVGLVLFYLLDLELNKLVRELHEVIENYDPVEMEVMESYQSKILCVLTTSRDLHRTEAIHLQRCDELLFTRTELDSDDAIGFSMKDEYHHLWSKMELLFHYVYQNFMDDYDDTVDITFEDGVDDEGPIYDQIQS